MALAWAVEVGFPQLPQLPQASATSHHFDNFHSLHSFHNFLGEYALILMFLRLWHVPPTSANVLRIAIPLYSTGNCKFGLSDFRAAPLIFFSTHHLAHIYCWHRVLTSLKLFWSQNISSILLSGSLHSSISKTAVFGEFLFQNY
jgi:hypothetical protein